MFIALSDSVENPDQPTSPEDPTPPQEVIFDQTYRGYSASDDADLIYFDEHGFIRIEADGTQNSISVTMQLPEQFSDIARVVTNCRRVIVRYPFFFTVGL